MLWRTLLWPMFTYTAAGMISPAGTDEDSTEDTTNQCLSSARDVILNSPHTMSEALERTLQRKRLVRQVSTMAC